MAIISPKRFVEILSKLEAETGENKVRLITALLGMSTLLLAAALRQPYILN